MAEAVCPTFTTPTLNGYKRYRPYALAPDRAVWSRDNRGVMVRVMGQPGDLATHLENRVGEPLANPYLYMASQLLAGLDGMAKAAEPPPSADAPYETANGTGTAPLPADVEQFLNRFPQVIFCFFPRPHVYLRGSQQKVLAHL